MNNAKNILSRSGIDTILKNEFAAGGIGELSAFDAWLELWVLNDAHYELACKILENAISDTKAADWQCQQCTESNDNSFDYCWNCQHEYR